MVTAMLPAPPVAGNPCAAGVIGKAQLAAPTWLTEAVWPPALRLPVRAAASGFFPTEYDTSPSPLPDMEFALMVIQGELLTAVQGMRSRIQSELIGYNRLDSMARKRSSEAVRNYTLAASR